MRTLATLLIPCLMMMLCTGLLPAAVSEETGAEVRQTGSFADLPVLDSTLAQKTAGMAPMELLRIIIQSDYQPQDVISRDVQADHEAEIEANQDALTKAGHWGVPTLVFEGEPFFGQDRIALFVWRLEQNGLTSRG